MRITFFEHYKNFKFSITQKLIFLQFYYDFFAKIEKYIVHSQIVIVPIPNFRLHRINEDVYASPDVWSIFTVSYQHYSTIGFLIGIVVGLAVSVLFPTDQKVDPRLLTPCVRNLVYPKYTPKNKSIVTKTDEYTAVSQDTKL